MSRVGDLKRRLDRLENQHYAKSTQYSDLRQYEYTLIAQKDSLDRQWDRREYQKLEGQIKDVNDHRRALNAVINELDIEIADVRAELEAANETRRC